MFRKILSPIDLAHVGALEKALVFTAQIARSHNAEVVFVGVTGVSPGALARTPDEYAAQLDAFAAAQASRFDIKASGHAILSTDPTAQINRDLAAAVIETGADLIVMATHPPGISDYIWSGHGAYLAAHSDASVALIRG